MMEQRLIPYESVHSLGTGPVLVLAPHPDDEVLGCGGAILAHVALGDSVKVAIVTDGAANAGDGVDTYAALRREESRAAARVLGYGEPTFWGLEDRGLVYGEPLIRRILDSLGSGGVRLVYSPSILERHPDHRVLAMAVLEAVRRLGAGAEAPDLAMYEVAVPLNPNRLLDITPWLESKRRAIDCFPSQLAVQDYGRQVLALNEFRSYTLPPAVTAAEAYLLVPAREVGDALFDLYAPEYERQRRMGLELDAGARPRVSLIVRTLGRPELRQALDSVALQTYSNLEICVVSAAGGAMQYLGEVCGRYPLRVVDVGEPLRRSRAANLGLDAAQGEYLMFLDDDDWLDPDHVAGLVDLLEGTQDRVAYSGIRCVYASGEGGQTEFNDPFDPVRLLAGNYIPIHAVLFHRELLEKGCRVDETLDLYEDWDFWIQLSQHAPFVHRNRVTASYRISGRSGFGVNAPPWEAEQAALKVYSKWRPLWTDRQLVKMMAYVRERMVTAGLPQVLAARDAALAELGAQMTALHGKAALLRDEIAEREGRIGELVAALAERDSKLADERGRLLELQQSLAYEAERVHAREAELAAIRATRAFRAYRLLGAPLRVAPRLVPFLRRALRDPDYGLNALKIVIRAGWAEGPAGVGRALAEAERRRDAPDPRDYSAWIAAFDTFDAKQRDAAFARIQRMPSPPLVSVLMPTYNGHPGFLRAAVESVRSQIYPHWELCIADDASTDPEVRTTLEDLAARDSRIKVTWRRENGHIAAASNSALALAAGDWVALLDHDDLLAPHALYWVAEEILAHPEAQLIYSDEDKIDENGIRRDPYFKPDWNPDLMRSHNLVCHLGVYRRELVADIGGFRSGLDGAQDYDLALRVVERVEPSQIRHIPRVLYHWRSVPGSTAASNDAKPYAETAALRALQGHLDRLGERGEVMSSDEAPGMYRVRYALPPSPPHVTLIILTRNRAELLRRCVDSVLTKTDYPSFDLLIVDNGSVEEDALDYLTTLKVAGKAQVLRDDRPFNYSALNNMAVEHASGPLVCLLNNDVEVIGAAWLREMVSHVLRPGIGAVGARLWYPDDTLQHGGVVLGVGGVAGHSHKGLSKGHPGYFGRAVLTQDVSAVTGACLLIGKQLFRDLGGLDENELSVAFNDVDLCLRVVSKGYRIVWTPYAELYHHESATRGYEDTPEKQARFRNEVSVMVQRWGSALARDPAYNPNLSVQAEDFSLAWPPRVDAMPPRDVA